MSDGIQLDAVSFYSKVQKLHQHWQKTPQKYDAFLAVQGKVKDEDPERPETSEFIMWLLHWEFSDTIIVMLKQKIIFGVSPKKASLLNQMQVPAWYIGPELQVLSRNIKQEEIPVFVTRVIAEIPEYVQKVAVFQKDRIDGDLSQKVFDGFNGRGAQLLEMAEVMQEIQKVKLDCEQKNMRMAAELTEWTFKRIVNEIEDIIEEDKKVKHSYIQSKIESGLDNEAVISQFLSRHPGIQSSFLEYPLPIQVQSGNNLQVNKFEVDSSDDKLNSQAVYINVCGKFCEMSAMASRTLLVDPKPEQKQAYMVAYEALEMLVNSLEVGKPISAAYTAAKNLIMQSNANLNLPQSFGFGIGFNYKERQLMIKADNETLVEAGMTFHVRVALSGISKEPARSIVAIGDTVLISEPGTPNRQLTSGIQKSYAEISYSLEESEDAAKKEESKEKKQAREPKTDSTKKTNGTKPGQSSDDFDGSDDDDNDEVSGEEGSQEILKAGQDLDFRKSRLRSKADAQKDRVNEAEDRKSNQMNLHKNKQRDLKIRFDKGEIKFSKAQKKVKNMDQIQAYRSAKDYPKDLLPGRIHVDTKRHAVLIPNTPTTWIPIHISTIKSVSDQIQGQWTFLRINFHTSGGNTMVFPPMEDPNNLWMKAMTMKTQSTGQNNRLAQASRQIKECMKQLKTLDQERDNKAAAGQIQQSTESLQYLKGGRMETLDSLVIRPNLIGRKTIGSLQIHQNGVRFNSTKGNKVDIVFSNVKHFFYQPSASDELVVLLHFHLKTPMLIGDKPALDVQFYKESGIAAEDINHKGRHKMNEMDELEQEEAERAQRNRLNKRYLSFAKMIEEASMRNRTKLEVDVPVDALAFTGCPLKQVVKIRPTKECLVALSEFPFFVLDVNDIEVVHFERMFYGMKNFDLAIIKKDFVSVLRINSIPTEYTEELKSYFNTIKVIYLESQQPLKWDLILQQIREDFDGWLEEGAWMQLVEGEDDGDEEESEDEEDPACDYDDEDDGESESEFSDDDLSDEVSSDMASESELSEAGQDWDDLEKQALEEDRKAGMQRQMGPLPKNGVGPSVASKPPARRGQPQPSRRR